MAREGFREVMTERGLRGKVRIRTDVAKGQEYGTEAQRSEKAWLEGGFGGERGAICKDFSLAGLQGVSGKEESGRTRKGAQTWL